MGCWGSWPSGPGRDGAGTGIGSRSPSRAAGCAGTCRRAWRWPSTNWGDYDRRMRDGFVKEAAYFARRYRVLLAVFAVVLAGTVTHRVVTGPNEVDWLPADAGRDWFAVCEGTAFTRAAPYEGPGPHPVKIFGAPSPGSGGEQDPDKPPASWNPERADQVRLVACAEQVEGETEGRVECPRYVNRFPLDPNGS